MELTLESTFSPSGMLGNASYRLLILSMSMRNMLWLRICGKIKDLHMITEGNLNIRYEGKLTPSCNEISTNVNNIINKALTDKLIRQNNLALSAGR